MATSKTGLWLDKLTGEVTHAQPERGRLLVPPGADVPDHVQAMVDVAKPAPTDTAAAAKKAPAAKSAAKKA